jgi:hypothetical protein
MDSKFLLLMELLFIYECRLSISGSQCLLKFIDEPWKLRVATVSSQKTRSSGLADVCAT